MSTDRCFGCFSAPRAEGPCLVCGYEHDRDAFPTALPPGDVLSRYVLGRVLGKPGGFGITYLAFDPLLNRRLAVKELMPRDLVARRQDGRTLQVHTKSDQPIFAETLQSFLNEARLIAQINHPNVVRVVDFFEANGTAYFAMDYYEGETLSQYLARSGGRLSGRDATHVMLPVLSALEQLHSMPEPILHRDIKPANIYLTTKKVPILLDFGAARVRLGVSRSLSTVLTPGFAPYEQYSTRGNQGPWSDVYACAATMYFLVTGRVPPEASERIEHPAVEDPCLLAPGLSRALGDAILYGIGFRPEERPRSAREFSALLTSDGATVPLGPGAGAATAVAPGDRATELAPSSAHAAAPVGQAAVATVLSPATQSPDPASKPGPSLWIWAGGSLAALLVAALALAQMGRAPAIAPREAAEGQQATSESGSPMVGSGQTPAVPLSQETNDSAEAAKLQPAALTAEPEPPAAGQSPAASPASPSAAAAPSVVPRVQAPVSAPPGVNAAAAVPQAAVATAESGQASPAPGNGVFVTVYGNDSSDALIVETTILRALQGRPNLRAMDQTAMSMARGDDAALAAANRGDFGALSRLGREQGAEFLVVCDLAARAVPSVGGFHTGTAELAVRMYQVSTSRLLGFESFRVGPGGTQAILALGEAEARSRAVQAAADQAARAAGNWLASGTAP